LEPDSKDALNTLFDFLSEGGTIIQALKEEFWGAIFGSVKDKFGIYWSLNYQLPTK
jgi:PhnB protein